MPDDLMSRIEEVYRTDYRKFLRVALGVLRDEDRAVDAVQEAFAIAMQKRRSYRGEGPLEAWIWRMVVNAALRERGKPRALALVGTTPGRPRRKVGRPGMRSHDSPSASASHSFSATTPISTTSRSRARSA